MTTAIVPLNKKPSRYSRGELSRAYPELPDYITPGEAHAILEAASAKIRDYLLFALLWNTGARITEALSLSLEHIRDCDLRIRGKGDKIRYIPVKPQLINDLLHYALERQLPYNGLFFPISRSQAHRLLQKYALAAGIKKKVHCHLFRHGFAVNFLKQMPNLVYLQELLGHSSIETTRIYVRAALPDVREALKQVEM